MCKISFGNSFVTIAQLDCYIIVKKRATYDHTTYKIDTIELKFNEMQLKTHKKRTINNSKTMNEAPFQNKYMYSKS